MHEGATPRHAVSELAPLSSVGNRLDDPLKQTAESCGLRTLRGGSPTDKKYCWKAVYHDRLQQHHKAPSILQLEEQSPKGV